MNNIEYLKEVFLFSAMPERDLQTLAEFCNVKKAGKREVLFLENQRADAFFYIISGQVKIYRMSDEGQEVTLEIHSTGDLFAEAAIFDKETYPANCQTLEETVLLRIPKIDFIDFIVRNPLFSIRIMHAYSRRLRQLVKIIEDQTLHDLKFRLAKHLLEKADKEDDKLIYKHITSKKELASMLGTIPESLSRTFKIFKDKAIIDETSEGVVIMDRKNLEAFL